MKTVKDKFRIRVNRRVKDEVTESDSSSKSNLHINRNKILKHWSNRKNSILTILWTAVIQNMHRINHFWGERGWLIRVLILTVTIIPSDLIEMTLQMLRYFNLSKIRIKIMGSRWEIARVLESKDRHKIALAKNWITKSKFIELSIELHVKSQILKVTSHWASNIWA